MTIDVKNLKIPNLQYIGILMHSTVSLIFKTTAFKIIIYRFVI